MFPPIVRTRRRHSEKVHGAEADHFQLVPIKKCAHQHIRASCSPTMKLSKKWSVEPPRRTSERITEDWKFMYRAQHLSDATILRCNGAVPWVNIASNDVDASSCLSEEKQKEHIDTETSRLTTTDL